MNLVLIYLAVMIFFVPIFQLAGMGAVLGYLVAGSLFGPQGLGLLTAHGSQIHLLAELGVIMMLFLIGLELNVSRLWQMRGPIFGVGFLQVLLTSLIIFIFTKFIGFSTNTALVIGMILSLSSTAIVLQTLKEKGVFKTTGGQLSFSVLLFQDIAVIPILAILPLMAVTKTSVIAGTMDAGWMQAVKILIAVGIVIAVGRYLVRPAFRLIARANLRELFTGLALFLILATTYLMQKVGLSPALGGFLAGVLLASSEYRHQLEIDIEPFKGLLLGLFFISVGAEIHYDLILQHWQVMLLSVLSFVVLKILVLAAIAKINKLPRLDLWLFSISLAQGGEFAFVLISLALSYGIFDTSVGQSMTALVALSMVTAPVLIGAFVKWILPLFIVNRDNRDSDVIDEHDAPVIVAGFGRFGQMVTRLLRSVGFQVTVLEHNTDQVEVLRRFGLKSFFGDASRYDLLRSAGIDNAKLLAITIDDKEKAVEILKEVKEKHPHLKVLARAYDRMHAYKLFDHNADYVIIETSGSAMEMGTEALKALGFHPKRALRTAQLFEKKHKESLFELSKLYKQADEKTYIEHAKSWISELEKIMRNDTGKLDNELDKGWESAPRAKVNPES